jgi:ribonuclease HI
LHLVHRLYSILHPFCKVYISLSSCIFQMNPFSYFYIGYANGASHYSRNLASTTWALFTPVHSLVHSSGISIGPATNNQVEYDAMIDLLVDVLDHRICHLHVCLDSQFLVMQLNDIYHVHNPRFFRKYIQVKLLVCSFESISFSHGPKKQNNFVDNIANNILDWHLTHAYIRR